MDMDYRFAVQPVEAAAETNEQTNDKELLFIMSSSFLQGYLDDWTEELFSRGLSASNLKHEGSLARNAGNRIINLRLDRIEPRPRSLEGRES
jgi:hypothetical protein